MTTNRVPDSAAASPRVTPDRAGLSYWREVLSGPAPSAVPTCRLDPVPRVAQLDVVIRGDLLAAARGVEDELGVPLSSLLLAADAKVLAALAGEPDVLCGYPALVDADPLPLRLTTRPDTWARLALETHRRVGELLRYKDYPLDELGPELGIDGPQFQLVFEPHAVVGSGGLPGARAILSFGPVRAGSSHALRLRYRADLVDAGQAARILGYHLAALRMITADPHAAHAGQSLLSPDERRYQLQELAGPRRPLPDKRFHELFQERVGRHPDRVAVTHAETSWTYGQLNARANRLARALLARGLQREDVVAVVTDRNLAWITAVLAVLKAGGAYLPIEPHFPADRIARMLTRAGCRFVVTDGCDHENLDEALGPSSDLSTLSPQSAAAEGHAPDDLRVTVSSDQLAYIYFTSGSTGEPKGAMCEHAGMLNHLCAKLDVLQITEGLTVAQTAPQCFDISLWQLLGPLLVGGRTLLVDQDVVLDVPRLIDAVAHHAVGVLQVVPSYLELLTSYLERNPRELPDLRYVSTTGEALTRELARRWFAVHPDIPLVNAYGLTETSDDTNHEVLEGPPARERVPLGRCIRNVRVHVVDESLALVPLGAPGLIAFSGVCVGRGYVNDPDRTRAAYLPDPHCPGERLYLGGDYGRWLPDGKLEFLGRRDNQVKVAGFRIELDEIENRLLGVPGVRDAVVVVTDGGTSTARLTAFYAAPAPLAETDLRDALARALPSYLVPSAFRWQSVLPLTANGKTDRRTLATLAARPDDGRDDVQAPRTPTERRLATAWSRVLGLPADRVDRRDHFFDRGGTSLTAIELAIALDRAVSLPDVAHHPVLADLAELLDRRSRERSSSQPRPHPST